MENGTGQQPSAKRAAVHSPALIVFWVMLVGS